MAGNSRSDSRATRGRTVVASLCAIGAIVPVALSFMRFWAGGGGSDFWSFWHAVGTALERGNVYGSAQVFPYPPHSLFLFLPFGLLPFDWGLLLFNFAGIAFFACAAKPYLPKGFSLVLALCSPAVLFCLFFGQTGLFVAGFWLFAFRGKWPAVAVLTFKPHLGLLSIFALKSRSEVLKTTGVAATLITASVIVFGENLWLEFIDAMLRQINMIGSRPRWLVMSVSPAIGYGFLGWVLFAIVAGILLAKRVNAFTTATAALLISPYGFHYDMPVASLGFALAIYCYWSRLTLLDRTALTGAFLVPVIVNVGTWWAPPILVWALWVQIRLPTYGSSETVDFVNVRGPNRIRSEVHANNIRGIVKR